MIITLCGLILDMSTKIISSLNHEVAILCTSIPFSLCLLQVFAKLQIPLQRNFEVSQNLLQLVLLVDTLRSIVVEIFIIKSANEHYDLKKGDQVKKLWAMGNELKLQYGPGKAVLKNE